MASEPPDTTLVTSTVFAHNTDIPVQYSAYGDNISPDISWANLPRGTMQLDTTLNLPGGMGKEELLEAMDGHVLATGVITGNYQHFE